MQLPMTADGTFARPAFSYAGALQRLAAILIDTVLLLVIGEVLAAFGVGSSIFTLQEDIAIPSTGLGEIVRFVLSATYFIVLNGRGATLGKRVVGIRVVNERGLVPGLRRGAIRIVIPGLVSIFPLFIGGTASVNEPSGTAGASVTLDPLFVLFLVILLFSFYDQISMLWHPRRQTLHDRMAGTFVVQVAHGALAPSGQRPSRLLPLVVILSTFLLLCVAGVAVGISQVDTWLGQAQENVADVMATSLEASCTESIRGDGVHRGSVRILERDVTVNNTAVAGQVGWETGTEGTIVFGMDLLFESGRIMLDSGAGIQYSGAPIVNGGRIELLDIRVPEDFLVVTDEGFERVIVEGLHSCLAVHGLAPTELSVNDNVMIIQVEAAP